MGRNTRPVTHINTHRLSRFHGSLIPGLFVAGCFLLLGALLLHQIVIQPDGNKLSVGPRFFKTLGWTSLQASLSTLFSITVGMAVAWALSHCQNFPGRKLYVALFSSALVLPTLVAVLGIVTILGRSGWLNHTLEWLQLPTFSPFIFGLTGIVLAHCYFNASYAARTLLNRFESIPPEQVKLASSLGLNAWQRFKLTELPAVAATVPGLAVTIFLLCFTSFAIVLTLGGSPKYNTLEVSIYEAIKLDFNLGRALGLALTQLSICALLVLIAGRTRKDNPLIAGPVQRSGIKQQYGQKSPGLRIVQTLIIGLAGLAFILPLLAVVADGLAADFRQLFTDASFQRAIVTSFSIAILSTVLVLATCIPLSVSYATLATEQRLAGSKTAAFTLRLLSFSSTLYLAVPSLVLGLGFFLLARTIGGSHLPWAIAALLTSNTLMVLPFAVATLSPAMVKSANRYDKLAFSLGLKRLSRWRLVESALLRPELAYIASLSFCMSLGDLGIIALFGSQDFITLPWLLYQKMGSYRTDEAAGIALIMLFITLTVFLLIPKIFASRHADA